NVCSASVASQKFLTLSGCHSERTGPQRSFSLGGVGGGISCCFSIFLVRVFLCLARWFFRARCDCFRMHLPREFSRSLLAADRQRANRSSAGAALCQSGGRCRLPL